MLAEGRNGTALNLALVLTGVTSTAHVALFDPVSGALERPPEAHLTHDTWGKRPAGRRTL